VSDKGAVKHEEKRANIRADEPGGSGACAACHELRRRQESLVAGSTKSKLNIRRRNKHTKEYVMSLGTILIILLVLALIGVLPTWGYSTSWGYAPGGIVGLLLVIIIILALLGRI
jgi:hypothetical protein